VRQKIVSIERRPALLLPRPLLRALGLSEGSAVELRLDTERARIEIAPVVSPHASPEARRFAGRVEEFIERHRRALERLAKG